MGRNLKHSECISMRSQESNTMADVSLTMAFRAMTGERFNEYISQRTIDYEKPSVLILKILI